LRGDLGEETGLQAGWGYCTLNRKKEALSDGANSRQMLPSTTDTDSGFRWNDERRLVSQLPPRNVSRCAPERWTRFTGRRGGRDLLEGGDRQAIGDPEAATIGSCHSGSGRCSSDAWQGHQYATTGKQDSQYRPCAVSRVWNAGKTWAGKSYFRGTGSFRGEPRC
jgi:hypothetical protein